MFRKIKLVIIEDSKDYLKLLCDHFFSSEKFSLVGSSRSALVGLKLIEEEKPDIALIDIVIPEYDGFWLLETLKEHEMKNKPSCVMITTATNEMVTRQAMELGAKYIFVKPFKFIELERRLEQIAKYHFEEQEDYEKIYAVKERHNMEAEISMILNRLGISVNLKGFKYLKKALIMCIQKRSYLDAMTKGLYVDIATEFDTTPDSVERAIRHAIDVSWNRDCGKSFNEVFTYIKNKNEKPSNKHFISIFVENYKV